MTATTSAVLSVTWGPFAADRRNRRRQARILATDSGCVRRAARLVENGKAFSAVADHGGSVPNNYGYAATTDGVVYLTVRDGSTVRVVVLAAELPANKVTLSGVGNRFGRGIGDVWDGRCGEARKAEAESRAEAMAREFVAAGKVRLTVVLSDEAAAIMDDATLTPEARRQAVADLCGSSVEDSILAAIQGD